MFSATLMRGTQALRSGSSGRQATACAAHLAAPARDRPRRARGISPPVASRWPPSTSTSSRWPLPETPAMPTISPARTASLTRAHAPAWPRSSSAARPVDLEAGWRRGSPDRGRQRPDLAGRRPSSARNRVGVELGDLPAADQRPRRSTVTSSAKAITSRNLWVMISTVRRPRVRHLAHHAEHLVGLLRRQHRGRLVEDQEAARRDRAA